MTRIPYDQSNKQLLKSALSEVGRVDVQHEVSTEPRWVDVWFQPENVSEEFVAQAGLLGRMVGERCAFEVFHASVGAEQALECLSKQLAVYVRGKSEDAPRAVPPMWIVCTQRPVLAMSALGLTAAAKWPAGFYQAPLPAVPLRVVVLSEVLASAARCCCGFWAASGCWSTRFKTSGRCPTTLGNATSLPHLSPCYDPFPAAVRRRIARRTPS